MALILAEKGYRNVKVVEGGAEAMALQGFPLMVKGKVVFPK